MAVIYLGRLLPNASSGRAAVENHLCMELEKDQPSFPALLPTGVYRASTSRCCWCALTAPLHPYQDELAVCFCGTILTVTRTGRYPASLVFRKPGLSSNDWSQPNHLQPPAPTLPSLCYSRLKASAIEKCIRG